MSKKWFPYLITYIAILLSFVYFSNILKEEKVKNFKEENYANLIHKSTNYLQTLIKEKQNSTASIGVSMANNYDINLALKKKNSNLINLEAITLKLRNNTDFKNVWFQLITKDGISLQRSWTKKKGDKISDARLDIQQMMKKPQIMNTISVGRFDLTFKSMSPIFDRDGSYLGIIEVITHFNSISKKLASNGIDAIILADKKYKKQLKFPLTKAFVDDYYVANFDVKEKLIKYFAKHNIEKTLQNFKTKRYIANDEANSLISYYSLNNIKNEIMAHFLLFHPLNNIEKVKIENIKYIYNLYLFLAIIFLTLIFYFIYSVKDSKKKNKSYKINVLALISIIYILIATAVYQLLDVKYKNELKTHNNNLKSQTLLKYNSIVNKNSDISQLIYSIYINKPWIKEYIKTGNREKLYEKLLPDYLDLRKKYNVRQIQFHLPNSRSFLRMNNPNNHGDNLSNIRGSVNYVNSYSKSFSGFEEGKTFNGYRNVFPLIYNDKQLASVEISFDIYSFMDNYFSIFDAKRVNFLISKKTIEKTKEQKNKPKYIPSPLKNFYFDNKVLNKLKELNKDLLQTRIPAQKYEQIENNILSGEPFVLNFESINESTVITPIINNLTHEVIGTINISHHDLYLKKSQTEFYTLVLLLLSILAFIMLFIYRETLSKLKVQNELEKNQQILDSQKSFIIISDGKNIIASNKSMIEFFGFDTLNEFKNAHNCICDFFLKETDKNYLDSDMYGMTWLEYTIKNKKEIMKVKMLDLNKKEHIFKIECENYQNSKKQYIISFIDITSIENINQQLNEKTKEQEKLLSLFDKGEITLFKWDVRDDYKLEYVSSNVEKIFGFKKELLTSSKEFFFEIIDKSDREKVYNTFKEAYTNNENFFSHEPYKIKLSDGTIKHLLTNSVSIKDEKGKINHILSYTIDITQLKDIEKQLIENEKMASLGNMIGNIAHQWRQPLSAITTAASGITVENDYGLLTDAKIQEYSDTIIKNSNFLSQTIDTFRNFIKETKDTKEIVVQERINTVLDIFEATLKNNFITVETTTHKSQAIKKTLPVGELSQVFTNILNNAKDALVINNIENPLIIIDCFKDGENIFITFEDNAGGIPEDILPKIFEPYFTTKHQSQGTGLGLYMSHKIVNENINGKLYAKNTELGAKFIIEIPLDY